jgi:hypothetical protein
VVDDVVALPVVGGDHSHPVQALGQVGENVGDAVPDPVVAALGRRRNQSDMRGERRHDEDDGDEGEAHVQLKRTA